MSQKGRIFREDNNLPGLLTIAQDIHCTASGSYQPATIDPICLGIQALSITLADWEESRSPFEEAVRVLCREALADGRNWLVEQLEYEVINEDQAVQFSGLDRHEIRSMRDAR